MTAESKQAEFLLHGNRLTVRGEVGATNEAQYAEALFKLLETESQELVVDLTGLNHVGSIYLGSICLLAHAAKQGNRSVQVVATPDVGRILTMTGLDKLAEVRIEGERPGSAAYDLDGNTLNVRGDVFDDEVEALQAAVSKLVASRHQDLVIDMSRVARIRGSHLGALALAAANARREGRSLTIIATERVRSLLDAAKLRGSGKVRVVSATARA